jgi:hypothetical protein
MASKKTRLAIAVLVVASFLAVAGNALAAYHPVLPGGLNQHNPVVALAQFNSRAAVDSSLGARLASNTGESTFNVSHYQAIGYGNASKNSTNTAVDDNGNSVPATDTNHCKVGAKVLIVLNVVTQNEAEICTGCANPRIARIITNLPKKPWTVSTVVRFHREMHKRFVKICPSGQKVFGKLDVLVSGLVRGRAWGTIQGKMHAMIRAQVQEKILATVKIKCGKAPKHVVPKPKPKPRPVPTPTAAPCSVNGVTIINSPGTQIITCPNFWVWCGNIVLGPYTSFKQANTAVCSNTNTPPVVVNCNCTSPPPPPPVPPTPPGKCPGNTCGAAPPPNNSGQPTSPGVSGDDPETQDTPPAGCVPTPDNGWCTGV